MKRSITPNAAKAASLTLLLSLAACASEPGEITRDTEPFSQISPRTQITVVGTEPFWAIDLEPAGADFADYKATYSSPENLEGSDFEATRFAGNNGLGFSGELDGEALQLVVTPGDCSDGMSDQTYPYSATMVLGDRTLIGCAYTGDEPASPSENP